MKRAGIARVGTGDIALTDAGEKVDVVVSNALGGDIHFQIDKTTRELELDGFGSLGNGHPFHYPDSPLKASNGYSWRYSKGDLTDARNLSGTIAKVILAKFSEGADCLLFIDAKVARNGALGRRDYVMAKYPCTAESGPSPAE